MSVQDFVRVKNKMEDEMRNGMPISQPAIKNFGRKDTEMERRKERWQLKPLKNKNKHNEFMN